MQPNLKINLDNKPKENFYASDFGKPAFDIYCSFKAIVPTNPPEWNETLKWGAGNGVEAQMLKVLKDSDLVATDYDQNEHGRIEIERAGIKVTGRIDAKMVDERCLEIKSINNKNSFDIKKYADGYPRENYVGQLAIYLDATGQKEGVLFVASVDGLSWFWLRCYHVKNRIYRCMNVEVDLDNEYRRWAKIYNENVLKNVEPDPFDGYGRYKIPLDEIDWGKVSKTDISKARNGYKVIGDPDSWKINYSQYKDLIVSRQGVELGYNQDELTKIIEATKGFSTK